jgi:hypothetical protein
VACSSVCSNGKRRRQSVDQCNACTALLSVHRPPLVSTHHSMQGLDTTATHSYVLLYGFLCYCQDHAHNVCSLLHTQLDMRTASTLRTNVLLISVAVRLRSCGTELNEKLHAQALCEQHSWLMLIKSSVQQCTTALISTTNAVSYGCRRYGCSIGSSHE